MVNLKTWPQSSFECGDKKSSRAWIALLIFNLALQVLSTWNLDPSGTDSPRVAGIAREMAVNSTYLIPRLNGENFLEYPPLGYWPIAFSLSMSQKPVGFLAFLPIAIIGTGTVLLTFLIGKTLAQERIGLFAGFILATMSGFFSLHRHCLVDPLLLFFITLSLYGVTAGLRGPKKNFFSFAVFYLATAGAFLSKGMIGIAIPVATAAVILISRKDFATLRRLFLTPGVLLFLLPIFLWAGSVWYFDGFGILTEVIRQSFWRFLSPTADHSKRFYFYLPFVFQVALPWTFLPLLLLWFWRAPALTGKKLPHGPLVTFCLAWFLVVFIGLSISSAKRALYLAPVFPPLALLAALGWEQLRERYPKVKRGEVYGLLVIFLAYVGVHLLFVIPMEKRESLRPVFEKVSSRQVKGTVYLVNPSETTLGASFFYLGRVIPLSESGRTGV